MHAGKANIVIERHPLPVRLWHWITAAVVLTLLFTGVAVFNVHPRLYWGEVGNATMPSTFGIEPPAVGASTTVRPSPAVLRVGAHTWNVTGAMGFSAGEYFMIYRSPRYFMKFGAARAYHFMAAWLFALAWLGYVIYLLTSGRLTKNLLPTSRQLAPGAFVQDVWDHLRLRRARGEAAAHYNLLQKLAYLSVVFVLVPVAILSGLTMSNTITARVPELFSLLGGRESARTVHAIFAGLLVAFVLIHIFQLFVAGFVTRVQAMITGRLRIDAPGAP